MICQVVFFASPANVRNVVKRNAQRKMTPIAAALLFMLNTSSSFSGEEGSALVKG
jgi:hypothetical protein